MSDRHSSRSLAAPAKLNLWLHVVGRRPDGFHELVSLLVLLELADRVEVGMGAAPLEVLGPAAPGVPGDQSNLAWRGWEAGSGGATPPSGLIVDKHIPAAAGLGGGSSDAAAAWRLARRAGNHPDERPDQAALAVLAGIGADVPFFAAQAAAARVGGIGEHVEAVDAPVPTEVVLIHPPFGLSTADVFGELRPADWSSPSSAPDAGPEVNDLLAPARRLRPELDEVYRLVAAAGGAPHLTGSGPTVFMATDDLERADSVHRHLERAGLATTRTRVRVEPASIEEVVSPQ